VKALGLALVRRWLKLLLTEEMALRVRNRDERAVRVGGEGGGGGSSPV
jgi:hypothetical protein